jgi:hypothetical protein
MYTSDNFENNGTLLIYKQDVRKRVCSVSAVILVITEGSVVGNTACHYYE